ncbi:MAG: hypothetical protein JXR32_10780 [Anaerolineaceae bacterium]|nr:hypothetical protein [Anaerolineaceae bacterium]
MQSDHSHTPATSTASLPVGLQVERDAHALCIHYSHYGLVLWLALATGILLLATGFGLMFTGGVKLVYMSSLAMGLVLSYCSLVVIINKWVILATRDRVSVSYRPLPFEKDVTISAHDIVQLYTCRTPTISKYQDIQSFSLRVILKSGGSITLMSDPGYETLHHMECQIEDWLGIQDVDVPGEI